MVINYIVKIDFEGEAMEKEYSYTTRNALWNEYNNDFKNTVKDKLNQDLLGIQEEIEKCRYDNSDIPIIKKEKDKMKNATDFIPSNYVRNNLSELVDCYVPKESQNVYYGAIDKVNQFQYSIGYSKRTVRTKSYIKNLKIIFSLLNDFMILGLYKCDLSRFLTNNFSDELLDYKLNGYSRFAALDNIIAESIDSGDEKVISCIKDIILSENNTAIVTREVIRGIIKSTDEELHKLLGGFLLAAKLQEGVRQIMR